MTGCWLPRTTLPATGAKAKLVVEGVAGMNGLFEEVNAWNIAWDSSRDKPAPTRAPSSSKDEENLWERACPAKRTGQTTKNQNNQ
ncbi:hypothetical protein C1X73_18595 [Pseudomonas sp. FW305-130]|nr:hypothetical protein C1X74_20110 [Pseudomonas sp. GW460-5]PNB56639.1 hypothetical protein C1X73_18595 [Pseudomonas sp. FW305-130]